MEIHWLMVDISGFFTPTMTKGSLIAGSFDSLLQ